MPFPDRIKLFHRKMRRFCSHLMKSEIWDAGATRLRVHIHPGLPAENSVPSAFSVVKKVSPLHTSFVIDVRFISRLEIGADIRRLHAASMQSATLDKGVDDIMPTSTAIDDGFILGKNGGNGRFVAIVENARRLGFDIGDLAFCGKFIPAGGAEHAFANLREPIVKRFSASERLFAARSADDRKAFGLHRLSPKKDIKAA